VEYFNPAFLFKAFFAALIALIVIQAVWQSMGNWAGNEIDKNYPAYRVLALAYGAKLTCSLPEPDSAPNAATWYLQFDTHRVAKKPWAMWRMLRTMELCRPPKGASHV
jgi:hypothetical protein